MFDLVNIFDTFLPQLLLYPNPSDPLNPSAAKLLKDSPDKYEAFVREHVKKNAVNKIVLDSKKKSTNDFPQKVVGVINPLMKQTSNNIETNTKETEEKNDDDKKSVISEASLGDINDEIWD